MRHLASGRRGALLFLALTALAPATAAAAPRTADDRDGNKLLNSLDRRLERSASSDRLDVIVVFADAGSRHERAEAERAVGDFAVKYHYRTLSAVAAEMTARQVRMLAREPDVDQIQLDAPMRADLDTARQAFGVNDAAAAAPAGFGVTGSNESGACPADDAYCADDVTVAVIDTGIHAGHVDLDGGKVLGFANCTNTTSCSEVAPFDDHGHGTHVASTIGGSGDGSALFGRTTKGVAPGATPTTSPATVPATCVPWPWSSKALLSSLAKSQPITSSTKPLPSSSRPFPAVSRGFFHGLAARSAWV